jgi:hypothetical protein
MFVSLGIPANKWRPGGGWSSLLTATTSLFAAVIGQVVSTYLSAQFITICPPSLLPFAALYLYGVTVNLATYATGTVALTNPGGGTYNIGAQQLMLANSFSGVTYTNQQPFTLGPLTTLANIAIQANTIGAVGSAIPGPGAGSVDTVVSTQLFAGTLVTVVNPAAITGLDADAPSLIVTKCLASIAARSYFGPDGAYQAAVLTALNGGNPVNINRWSETNNPSTGQITVYLASPSGAPTPGDIAAVQANIAQVAQPQGITATAVSCVVVPLTPVMGLITVWARGAGGATTPAVLLEEVTNTLVAALALYPISGIAQSQGAQGYLYSTFVTGAIKSADPLIFDVQGFSADLPLNPGQVAALTSATNIQIRQVP